MTRCEIIDKDGVRLIISDMRTKERHLFSLVGYIHPARSNVGDQIQFDGGLNHDNALFYFPEVKGWVKANTDAAQEVFAVHGLRATGISYHQLSDGVRLTTSIPGYLKAIIRRGVRFEVATDTVPGYLTVYPRVGKPFHTRDFRRTYHPKGIVQ